MSDENQQQSAQCASSVIYTEVLPDGNLYVGTEPPAGKECLVSELTNLAQISLVGDGDGDHAEEAAVELQNPLSILPQNLHDCIGHEVWMLSKKCVVCKNPESGGFVTSNPSLFRHYGCNFIRACLEHHAMVSDHFRKPEFFGTYDGPETRWCSQCRRPFITAPDSSSSFCDKGCQGNWLDSRFG
jgi:hypothetical protein